jgi:hypothetical protein
MNRFGAFSFGDYAAQTVKGATGSSVIKMIQQGSITIAAASLTNTYTISPAITTLGNAILLYNGRNGSGANTDYGRIATRIAITNTTTITATRENSTTDSATVDFTIVEFASGVNSIQAGTISIATSGTSNTATLGTGVGSNAFVIWQGASYSNGTDGDAITNAGLSLNTGTGVVTATTGQTRSAILNVGYMVADLGSTIVNSIAASPGTAHTAASATDTDTISGISTTGNSLLIYGGESITSTGDVNVAEYASSLTNSTTVTLTRNSSAGTASRTHFFTAVQFAAAALNGSVQRGTVALSSQTSNTATITSVNTAKSFVNWGNFLSGAGNIAVLQPTLVLTNGTTVTAATNSTGSPTVGYEVIQFA